MGDLISTLYHIYTRSFVNWVRRVSITDLTYSALRICIGIVCSVLLTACPTSFVKNPDYYADNEIDQAIFKSANKYGQTDGSLLGGVIRRKFSRGTDISVVVGYLISIGSSCKVVYEGDEFQLGTIYWYEQTYPRYSMRPSYVCKYLKHSEAAWKTNPLGYPSMLGKPHNRARMFVFYLYSDGGVL